MRARRALTIVLSAAVMTASAVLPALSSVAASAAARPAGVAAASSSWAQWSAPEGSSHDFRGSVQLPAGAFPAATWTSDSRSPVQLPTGSSTFLSAATPPGARYGSSQGSAYLNLRPYADNATSPSTSTFDFAAATPTAGWSFVLGDVDADQVHIAARDADGQRVPDSTIDRWEQGAFNYAGGTDRPTWEPDTATLVGNPTATDTNGASDWFTPDRALSSLTLVFTQRSGFPVYQLWFATRSHDVAGTVAGTTGCPAADSTVRLLGPDGAELDSAHPRSDGSYSFAGYAAQPGYTVAVEAPTTPVDGCEVTGAAQRTVDLSDGNAVADFAVRDVVPQPVAGTVSTSTGDPVPGVVVTLTPPTGAPRTATTDDAGHYLVDANPLGTGYRVAVTAPPGYTAEPPSQHAFDITAGHPVPDQDFTLRELPTVSGTVTDADGPLEAVPVTLTDSTGTVARTTTDGSGRYRFDHVPAGSYAISVTAPAGYLPPQDRESVTVGNSDVTGEDFTLTRAGTVAGTVTDNERPVPDVTIVVRGPSGELTTRTDADGTYRIDQLGPATYTVTVHARAGYTITGTPSRTVTITAAGELRGGLDFTVRRAATIPSSSPTSSGGVPSTGSAPAPTGGAGDTPSTGGTSRTLADTGAPIVGLAAVALSLLLAGAGVSAAGRRPRHR